MKNKSGVLVYRMLNLYFRNEFMRQFLLYGHVLTTEEIEAHAEEGVPENPPTLKQFKEQVSVILVLN
jgi:dynein heavy chain